MTKTKNCQNCKKKFIIEPADSEFYKKIDVPEPTFCPNCRAQRRMAFRNERTLYKRKVKGSDKDVFSSVSPDSPFKVYYSNYWWSDKMDAMEYSREYDFNKPFFEQLKGLMLEVGLPHSFNFKEINSPYTNNVYQVKDCYLIFNAGFSENCVYGISITSSRDCFDVLKLHESELCYELFNCSKCYQVFFSAECRECSHVWFSQNLVNCHNCFGCVNLRHKKYYIFNEPYSKQEYEKKIKEFSLGSHKKIQGLEQKTRKFHLRFPVKFMHGDKNVDVLGDYLNNCKNVNLSFINRDLEDCSYCQLILFLPSKDCYDMSVAGGELCYEIEESGGYKIRFSWVNMPKDLKGDDISFYDLEYNVGGLNCSNLFGCVGLRHKQYCILNKQYTKEEYEKLVTKIKGHMNEMPYKDRQGRIYKYGEFFPIELSPFAYNETIAQDYFPLTKKQAIEQGHRWYDRPKQEHQPTIKARDLPDNIKDVNKSILKEIVECDNESKGDCDSSGVFKIIPAELEFYEKQNLPLPRLCPDCRRKERMKKQNPLKLWQRECMCAGKKSENGVYQNTSRHSHKNKPCPNTFQTTYAPEKKEIVYCEKCYLKEVG